MRTDINITWEDALLDHDNATELDWNTQILIEIIPKMGEKKEDEQLKAITKLTGVSLLSQSSSIRRGCLQLHNVDRLTDCMGDTIHTVALVGFGDITSPVTINVKNLLETSEDELKTLKALMEIKTKNELMEEWHTNAIGKAETHQFCNNIVLSPWILQAILAKEASSVEEIFLAV